MTEDEQVDRILKAWVQADDVRDLQDLATRAVRALNTTRECGARHPQRASIVCDLDTDHAGVVLAHRNSEHQVEWWDTGRTIHVDLGEVVLVDLDSAPAPEPTDLRAHWLKAEDDCPGCLQHGTGHIPLVPGQVTGTLHCRQCDGLFMEAGASQSEPEPTVDLAQMLLHSLLQARTALQAVNQKYLSDSKTINAALIRKVRAARDNADTTLELTAVEAGKESAA